MAKTTTKKKKAPRVSRRVIGMNAMPTDNWFHAKHYTHYEVESREWGTLIKNWIKNNLDKKDLSSVNALPEWRLTTYSHWATVIKLMEKNPDIIPQDYKTAFYDKFINKLIEDGNAAKQEKKKAETPKAKNTISIQDRISEQSRDACEEIEQWLEGYITDPNSFDPRGFDFTAHFATTKITQAHARKIKKYYQGWLEEAREVVDMPTPAKIKQIKDPKKAEYASQLREGYSQVKKSHAKKWQEALENLQGACDLVIDSAKAARKPRLKKAPSKEKLIAKLKYRETDERYQLASVNPLEILDSKEVWVFNSKTRKLGRYICDAHSSGISVKGTTLVGFDENLSVQKTLRKPEETLKEFRSAGKIKLRKFLDNINTTDTKLNGRINSDTLILKVF